MGWVLTLPLPTACPQLCNKLLSLPSPCLFTWHLGASGLTCIWSLRSLGLGSKTPVSLPYNAFDYLASFHHQDPSNCSSITLAMFPLS
jgi:hypothetical protein